jgi:hypothetical protein
MSIEMHYVVGIASLVRELQFFRELLVGRGAQDIELEGFAILVA